MIEKGKIKNLIYDVFCCDTSDEYNLLYAYCTCKSVSAEVVFSEDIEKAYLNAKKKCPAGEEIVFLRISASRKFDKLEKLCNCISMIRFVDFLSKFTPNLVCNPKELVHLLKANAKLDWLSVGLLIYTINLIHNKVSFNKDSSIENMYKDIINNFSNTNAKKLKLSNTTIIDLYKAICIYKLDYDGNLHLSKEVIAFVEFCTKNGIDQNDTPELILAVNNNSTFQKFAKSRGLCESKLLHCRKKIREQSHDEITLLCAASYEPNKNDIFLDTKYIYHRFAASFSAFDAPTVIVVSPSDFFIKKLIYDTSLRDGNFVIVLDSIHRCKIYKKYMNRISHNGSGYISFYTFDELSENHNFNANSILLFATHTTKENQQQFIKILPDICSKHTQVYSLHESSEFERASGYISRYIKTEEVNLQEIDILPLGILYTEGRSKKILVEWSVDKESAQMAFEKDLVKLKKINLIDDGFQYLSKSPETFSTSKKELITSGNSVRNVYRRLVYINKSGQTRASAKKFRFSEEISVFYTTDDIQSDGTVRLRLCVHKPSAKKHNGVIIEESKRNFRNVIPINIPHIIEEYIYGFKGDKLIRDILNEHCFGMPNKDTLSLKTFFYNYFYWDEWKEKEPSLFDYAKEIVHSEIGEFVVSKTTAKVFERAFYELDLCTKELDFEIFKSILERIYDVAVSYRFCERNIWDSFSPDSGFDQKESYNVIHRAREMMFVKLLTQKQFNSIYDLTIKKIKSGHLEYVAVLIKLFTGLTNREISNLIWAEFIYSPKYRFYMLMPKIDENKYEAKRIVPRGIPCVNVLAKVLLYIKSELLKRYTEQDICMMPIVPKKGKNLNIYDPCSPDCIKVLCKDILKFIPEKDNVIHVTDGVLSLGFYHGDLIREAFKKLVIKNTELTDNEISVVMGVKPEDTADLHYIAYEDEGVLFPIYEELCKLEELIM